VKYFSNYQTKDLINPQKLQYIKFSVTKYAPGTINLLLKSALYQLNQSKSKHVIKTRTNSTKKKKEFFSKKGKRNYNLLKKKTKN
jgi:hypothetical protein